MDKLLPNIVDGFSYNTTLEELPLRWPPMALAQMETLRRAANYRPHWYVAPDDLEPIAAYDTFYYQVRTVGGAYLWGYRFSVVAPSAPTLRRDHFGVTPPPEPTDALIQVTDSCSGIPLFQDYISGGGAAVNQLNTPDFGARVNPVLLSQPRLVLEDGLVNVEIANKSAAALTCQLLLMFAEPCRLITEESREREWATLAG
jgi:hypothetical protein